MKKLIALELAVLCVLAVYWAFVYEPPTAYSMVDLGIELAQMELDWTRGCVAGSIGTYGYRCERWSKETDDASVREIYAGLPILEKPSRLICELPAEERLAIRQIVEEEIEAAFRSRR